MASKINQKKLPRIFIPHGMYEEIAAAAGCNKRTVWLAAKGQIDGPKSEKARHVAEMKIKELINQSN